MRSVREVRDRCVLDLRALEADPQVIRAFDEFADRNLRSIASAAERGMRGLDQGLVALEPQERREP